MSATLPSHSLGLPRIGAQRELKTALEAHWAGTLDEAGLRRAARSLRQDNLRRQTEAGLSLLTVGDWAMYDHVLSTVERYTEPQPLSELFRRARGAPGRPAWDLTKWFDTNYHYLVPELGPETRWDGGGGDLLEQVDEALALGIPASRLKAVLLGPVTLLSLARWTGPGTVWQALDGARGALGRILAQLKARGLGWVQVDEPVLALDADPDRDEALRRVYAAGPGERPSLLLCTYFGPVDHQKDLLRDLTIEGLHLDLVRGSGQLAGWDWPQGRVLSLGLIDGRQPWRVRPEHLPSRLSGLPPSATLWVGTSCSLLHLPVDLAGEGDLPPALRGRLAFATQKLAEVAACAAGLPEPAPPPVRSGARQSEAALSFAPRTRRLPYAERQGLQARSLALPLFPTTTIGSFPQTEELRSLRAQHRSGRLEPGVYENEVRRRTAEVIRWQDQAGLDVLVHGEFERTDMVEWFGEQLEGFALTRQGWVQSYGSRCVKPPVLHGEVSRPRPLSVDLAAYCQGLSAKPVKGMLTGPVTILQWSFVRDDKPRAEVAFQVAEALAREVADLEAAGIKIIQVDEAALREGLPLRRADHDQYWAWAVEAFHRTVDGVRPETQIHTHMCYSDFAGAWEPIAALDADVLTVECSRSSGSLLDDLGRAAYPAGLGPGVWDIHSPGVPEAEAMVELMRRACRVLPPERLWMNPDCGLKTRAWPETEAGVRALVEAARRLRAQSAPESSASTMRSGHQPS